MQMVSWSGCTSAQMNSRAKVPVLRPLDASRNEHPVGVAVDEQCQHRARVVLRLPTAAMVDPEAAHGHPLHRRQHKVGEVVLGHPLAQVYRQKQGLGSGSMNFSIRSSYHLQHFYRTHC